MTMIDAISPDAERLEEKIEDIYSRSNLTRMQMLYWTGQQLRPDLPLFTAALTYTIHGPVDVDTFRQALQIVVDHSDALRTVIKQVNGVPQRQVLASLTVRPILEDFSQRQDPMAAAREWAAARCTQPLDVTAQLFDVALLKVAPDRFIWYLNQHHVISDAAACFLVFDRVKEAYEQLCRGAAVVPRLAPFADYVDFERQYRQSKQYKRAADYWARQLDQNVTSLRFFGRPSHKTSTRTLRVNYDLGAERTQKIKEIARQEGVFTLTEELSLFNVLAALYFVHIFQLTHERRLSFLSPVHNRPTLPLRQTIGLIMEMCPFIVEIEEDETFLSLIQRVQKQTRGIMRHYQYGSSIPVQKKVHDLMFNYHRRPILEFAGYKVQQAQLYPGHSNDSYALHVHEFEETGTFLLKFDFHEDVFTAGQRDEAIAAFVALIDALFADIHQPVSQFCLPWDEPELTAMPEVQARPYVAPRDILELRLKHIWERELGLERIGIHDNFFDLGGNSWQAMNLFAEIEKLTGHYLALTTLLEAGTIAELAQRLRDQDGTDVWPTIVKVQEGAAEKRPFFCVHGGGGHVLIFNRLAQQMGADQPFYAFQAQGLDGKQPPLTTVEAMAARYVAALRECQPEGPYAIGGYSMGGSVAFEMARRLESQGQQVDFLAIIDTPAQSPALKWVRRGAHLLAKVARLNPRWEDRLFLYLRHRLWIGWRRNIVSLLNKFKPSRSVPGALTADKEIEPTQQKDRRVEKITAINNRAFYFYIPAPINGRITLFKSTEGYRDIYRDTKDPKMGWQKLAADGVQVKIIHGNHHEIMNEPRVSALAQALRSCIDELGAGSHSLLSVNYDEKLEIGD